MTSHLAARAALALALLPFVAPLFAQATSSVATGALAALTGTSIISRDVVTEPGDTFLSIARRELGSAAYARPLVEFNELDVEIDAPLPLGQIVRLPIQVPARGETALVAFVKGAVTRLGVALERDALVAAGDIVVTGADGFVSLEFSSGSVVTIQPDSVVRIERLSCLERDDSCLIDLAAERGKLGTEVEVRDGQPVEFRITTPFASAAVRGTVFDTIVEPAVLRAAVIEGVISVEALGQERALPGGFGSVTVEGEPPGEPRELLPAPVFRNVPTRVAVGDTLLWFGLSEAVRYSATLALDPEIERSVAEFEREDERLEIGPELASGDYYLALRGIDEAGLPGFSATARVGIADIDEQVAPVTVRIVPDGSEFRVEIVDPPPDAAGFEVQVSTTDDFADPLSLEIASTGQAVIRLDADTLYARARTLIDPFTVSAFGPVASTE